MVLFIAMSAWCPPAESTGEGFTVSVPKGLKVAESSDGKGNGVYRLGNYGESAPDMAVLADDRKHKTGKTIWKSTEGVWTRALKKATYGLRRLAKVREGLGEVRSNGRFSKSMGEVDSNNSFDDFTILIFKIYVRSTHLFTVYLFSWTSAESSSLVPDVRSAQQFASEPGHRTDRPH